MEFLVVLSMYFLMGLGFAKIYGEITKHRDEDNACFLHLVRIGAALGWPAILSLWGLQAIIDFMEEKFLLSQSAKEREV